MAFILNNLFFTRLLQCYSEKNALSKYWPRIRDNDMSRKLILALTLANLLLFYMEKFQQPLAFTCERKYMTHEQS